MRYMINEAELLSMIKDLESFNIEKTTSTTDTNKFCQAICAFSNDYPNSGKPGYLFLGVRDDGTLSGLRITDKLNKNISGLRTDGKILPLPVMSVGNFRFPDGDVMVVEVIPSMEPPVKFDGRTWIRNGARKGIASYQEEQRLVERRSANYKSFDIRPCFDATLEDLDKNLIKEYLSKAVDRETLSADPRSLEDKMSSLRLYDKRAGRPTNAAVILFGRSPKTFLPGAYIQYVQFLGKDNASDVVDEKIFARNLIETLRELDNFIESAIVKRRPVKISALQEVTEQNYPVWAVRELAMNAVMHRDYDSNAPIKFYQYSDRIDIVNPGGLYGNATPSNFPNVNDYRNPIVAEAMKVYGYVNKFNRGIAKVQEELTRNGNGLAIFSLDKETVFDVKVAKAIYSLRAESMCPEDVNQEINEGANYDTNREALLANQDDAITNQDGVIINQETGRSALFDNLKVSLPPKSLLILGFCRDRELTKKEIFALLGVTNQTNNVRTNIAPLIGNGLLARSLSKLSSKGQRYVTTKLGSDFLDYINGLY